MEATAAAPAARRRPSLARYAERRIGDGTTEQQLFNLLVRPFAAPTFAGFWRTFNPLYSYYLYYWSYRPLRRRLPRPLAELITFAVSGFFLHELPLWLVLRAVYGEGWTFPWITTWFVLAGAVAIAAEMLHVELSRLPFAARIAVNLTYLADNPLRRPRHHDRRLTEPRTRTTN